MVSFRDEELKNLLENSLLARSLIKEGDTRGNTPLHVLAAVHDYEFDGGMNRKTKANYHAVNKQAVSVGHIFNYAYELEVII